MKLAEALILRSDCQKRVEQIRQRLILNAKVQDGETPAENPQDLLAELETTINELGELIRKINKTNTQTLLQDALTIADALARRDMLILKRSAYSSLVAEASQRLDRYSRSEIKSFSTVSVAEIQKEVDRISKECRELDTQIQAANWNAELID